MYTYKDANQTFIENTPELCRRRPSWPCSIWL